MLTGIGLMLIAYSLSCLRNCSWPNQLPSGWHTDDLLVQPPWQRPLLSNEEPAVIPWTEAWQLAGSEIPRSAARPILSWVQHRNQINSRLIQSGQLPTGSMPAALADQECRQTDQPYLNLWTISQRAGSISYTLLGGAFAMVLLPLFVWADRWNWRLGLFRTLGVNALLGYILHDLVNQAIKPFVPRDAPLWYVFTGFAISLLLCYLILRSLEKRKIILKL
jgi:hypothetical protein